jgi:beta-galactosidase
VWCYTNCDSVELSLNGKSLGTGTRKDLHVEWSVPYEAGTLRAVATRGGQVVATEEVTTAGPPARLLVTADRPALRAGVRDQSFVTVSMVDAAGHRCPTADAEVTYALTGPATIAGVGNGDATNHESFQGHRHKLFNGLGLVVIQVGDDAGPVTLTATADGVPAATATIDVQR